MPEFRFRRRKPQNRRHTLHDAEESAAQIKAAKKQIQSVENGDEVRGEEGEEGKRNSMVQEREKFFELLKHKCSDETTRIELDHVLTNGAEEEEEEEEGEEETLMVNGHVPTMEEEPVSKQDDLIKSSSTSELPSIKGSLVRRISSRHSECLFLQHGEDLRRCPMPSPITLSTIKNLFVNMFDLSPSLLDEFQCSILLQEKDTHQWKPLESMSNVQDRCILLLVESPPDHVPSYVSDHVLSHVPNQVPDQVPNQVPNQVPDQVPDQVSDHVLNHVPDHIPDHIHDHTPDHVPNHVPNYTANQDSDINMPLSPNTPDTKEPLGSRGSQSRSKRSQRSQRSQGSHGPSKGSHGSSKGSKGSHGSSKESQRSVKLEGSQRLQKTLDGVSQDGPITKVNNGLWRTNMGSRLEDLTALPDIPPYSSSHTTIGSPLSITSSTSGVGSEVRVQPFSTHRDDSKLASRVHSLHHSVRDLKQEVETLRSDHATTLSDFQHSMMVTSDRITAAIEAYGKIGGFKSGGTEVFRRERLELYPQEGVYTRRSQQTFQELSVLETVVEEMRVDVVGRRCRVMAGEVDALALSVAGAQKAVTDLKARYTPLEAKLKRVMEQELQVIVNEERFLQQEGAKISEVTERCRKLLETLGTLKQYATVQSHRSPLVPVFVPNPKPDRQALMENIEAITPNHMHRMECISLSESVHKKKKEFSSPKLAIRKFENQLKLQRKQLRPTKNLWEIENRREMKRKASFIAEKFEREKQISKEVKAQRQLAEKQRQEEKRELEEKLLREHNDKVKRRKSLERRSQHIVLHSILSDGSKSGSSGEPKAQKHVTLLTKNSGSVDNILETSSPQVVGRASLPAAVPQRSAPSFQPRNRKSIDYSGEFETYDTLEPKKEKKPSHVPGPAKPHLNDGFSSWNQVSPQIHRRPSFNDSFTADVQVSPRARKHVHSSADSQVVLRQKKPVAHTVPNRYGVYEPEEARSQPKGMAVVQANHRPLPQNHLEQGSPHWRQSSWEQKEASTQIKPLIRSNSNDSIFSEEHQQSHKLVENYHKNHVIMKRPHGNKPNAIQYRSSMYINSDFKQPRNETHVDTTTSSITSVAVSPGRKYTKFHHSYTQYNPQRSRPPKSHTSPSNHRTKVHNEDAAVSRPAANFVDTRSAVSDHGPAHWYTSENHGALSDPAQFQYHFPHHAQHNQQPFHSHARQSGSAPHKQTVVQPDDVPLTSYPRFRLPSGHPTGGGRKGRTHHHHSGMANGRITHYPNHPVRDTAAGSLV